MSQLLLILTRITEHNASMALDLLKKFMPTKPKYFKEYIPYFVDITKYIDLKLKAINSSFTGRKGYMADENVGTYIIQSF
jgi:LmbE family N-acetylglucosaminyl deacetylase